MLKLQQPIQSTLINRYSWTIILFIITTLLLSQVNAGNSKKNEQNKPLAPYMTFRPNYVRHQDMHYAEKCEFPTPYGSYLGYRAEYLEQCLLQCLDEFPKCTHFTWDINHRCELKEGEVPLPRLRQHTTMWCGYNRKSPTIYALWRDMGYRVDLEKLKEKEPIETHYKLMNK